MDTEGPVTAHKGHITHIHRMETLLSSQTSMRRNCWLRINTTHNDKLSKFHWKKGQCLICLLLSSQFTACSSHSINVEWMNEWMNSQLLAIYFLYWFAKFNIVYYWYNLTSFIQNEGAGHPQMLRKKRYKIHIQRKVKV